MSCMKANIKSHFRICNYFHGEFEFNENVARLNKNLDMCKKLSPGTTNIGSISVETADQYCVTKSYRIAGKAHGYSHSADVVVVKVSHIFS